jgi:hypothetical protein
MIYVLKDGLRYGPYSIKELQHEIDTGVFKPEHFASKDDCHSWNRISKLPELAPHSFSVEVDQPSDLLIIRYRGRVGRADVDRCLEEVRSALPNLSRGFRLLADFSQVEEMDISCASTITKIMDLCNEACVSTVVRIIPQPKQDIGLHIMSFFHYRDNVCIVTCNSTDEAFKILDQNHENPAQRGKVPPSPDRKSKQSREDVRAFERNIRRFHQAPPAPFIEQLELMKGEQQRIFEADDK